MNHVIIYLLTSLAQAILRNIVPWLFLYRPCCTHSVLPQRVSLFMTFFKQVCFKQ